MSFMGLILPGKDLNFISHMQENSWPFLDIFNTVQQKRLQSVEQELTEYFFAVP